MRIRSIICLLLLLISQLGLAKRGFVENKGQWKGPFSYKAHIPGGTVFLENGAITFLMVDDTKLKDIHDRKVNGDTPIGHHAFKLKFLNANPQSGFRAENPAPYYHNYYLGNDRSKWQTRLYPIATVVYENLYDGIDLHVTHLDQTLKYEFHLDAGADPSQIKIATDGLEGLELDRDGNLVMKTSLFDIRESKPVSYQLKGKRELPIPSAFRLDGDIVTYELEDYDSNLPLVIDPIIVFSTYSGSSADNWGFTATPDLDGNLYGGGIAFGSGYPTTSGAFDQTYNQGEYDIAISKYNASGTGLIYSTYLGGDQMDQPHSMIVNENGNLYILGSTGSSNFPTTANAIDDSFGGGPPVQVIFTFEEGADIFVTGFNSSGTALIGSTFLGGDDNDGLNLSDQLEYNYADEFRGEINLDDDGNVYVASCTYSDDFPTTVDAFQSSALGQQDGVILKMNPSLSQLIWSAYYGGNNNDAVYGVDIASDGSVFIAGGTSSSNLENTFGSVYPNPLGGRADGFIAHISALGDTIIKATYYGTNAYDQIQFIQLDRKDRPNLFGQTEHAGSNLIFNANFNDVGGGQILGVLTNDLTDRIWTTQFGSTPGAPNISPTAFLVDVCNSVYVSGWGGPLNQVFDNNASTVDGLPTTNDAFRSQPDFFLGDFYMAVLSNDGNSQIFGTFFGGDESEDHVDGGTSRFDRGGKIYHSVCASCGILIGDDFPIVPDPGAWAEESGNSNCNNAVFKIDFELPIVVADFNIPSFACAPFNLSIQNNSVTQTSTTFAWDFGNGQSSTAINPTTTFNSSGTYDVTLIVSDPTSCNLKDTLVRTITIAQDTNYVLPPIERCPGEAAVIGPDPQKYGNLDDATISWLPLDKVDNPNILNPTAIVNNTTTFLMVIDFGGCQERIKQDLVIDRYPTTTSGDTIVCSSFTPFQISGSAFGVADSFAWSLDPDFNRILTRDSIYTVDTLSSPITNFYFRTEKPNGCQSFDTLSVTQSDRDLYLTNDTLICRGDSFRVEAQSNNPLNTFDFYWTQNGYSLDSTQVIAPLDQSFLALNIDSAQKYFVTAVSNKVNGCIARDSVLVELSTLDRRDIEARASVDTFYRGQQIQLIGTPDESFVSYFWTPTEYMTNPRSATPQVRPKEETTYIWVVTDEDSPKCTYRDSVTVSPYEIICDTPFIYLPTAFSPDGDGINEELKVFGNDIESLNLSIYDRWGNEVFTTQDQSIGWDGTINGEKAPRDVYVYQLEVTCITREIYRAKGNVTLIE